MKKRIIYGIVAIFIGVLFLFCIDMAFAASSNITQVVFTTESRSIAPGTISDPITIQVQNAGGAEEKLDSTADVSFTSSSDAGEFLGSTGNAVTKTMSSGSANKTFYYMDNTTGEIVITAKVTIRATGVSWTNTQKIYVGVDKPADASDTETVDDNTDDQGSNSDTPSGSSIGGGSTSKNKSVKNQTLKISAGKVRNVVVNSPVYFDSNANMKNNSIRYTWSFGDGDSDSGEQAKHVYYFPGEYNVVLTARYKDKELVSRTKVKVLDNTVSITNSVPGEKGYVELKNDGASEINVIGWEIKSAGKKYLVSTDTIINPKSSIRIPNKVMHFSPDSKVELMFPTDEIAYEYNHNNDNTKAQLVTFSNEQFGNDEAIPVMQDISISSSNNTNYATTVHAVITEAPKSSWRAFVKSFFSVE